MPIAVPTPVPLTPTIQTIATADTSAAADVHGRSNGVEDSPPSALAYLNRTTVTYPAESLRHREHGTVLLRVLVGVDGHPQQIDIEKTSGSRTLDEAARDAVRNWTFAPGMRAGVAYAAWARVPINFALPL